MPVHERTLLSVQNPSAKIAAMNMDNIEDDSGYLIREDGVELGEERVFSFGSEMLRRLKRRAGAERMTAYDVLCVHLWRCVSRARGHQKGKKLGLASVLDMRTRMGPALPEGYFGNALLWVMATATMGELEEEELATTAKRIRTAISSVTTSSMNALQHWLEIHGTDGYRELLALNGARVRVGDHTGLECTTSISGVRSWWLSALLEWGIWVRFFCSRVWKTWAASIALAVSPMRKLQNDRAFISDLH